MRESQRGRANVYLSLVSFWHRVNRFTNGGISTKALSSARTLVKSARKCLWHWLTFEFALHPAMRFWPSRCRLARLSSRPRVFPQSLTGGVVGQRKSGLCKHQKKHHRAVLKEKLTSHLTRRLSFVAFASSLFTTGGPVKDCKTFLRTEPV